MATAEISQGNPGVARDGVIAERAGIPSPDEVFDMFEKGEFDPRPESEAKAEPSLLAVIQKDVLTWARDRAQALRDAGHRGTWRDRRDIRGRHGNREKPPFVGKYAGKCAVTPELLETELGVADPNELLTV